MEGLRTSARSSLDLDEDAFARALLGGFDHGIYPADALERVRDDLDAQLAPRDPSVDNYADGGRTWRMTYGHWTLRIGVSKARDGSQTFLQVQLIAE